jgi:large subunit ribosomal protein L6
MSRIGKKPIDIPTGVTVSVADRLITVKGPKGELSHTCAGNLAVAIEDSKVVVTRATESQSDRALHGLLRSLLSNMVTGVSQGFTRVLEIKGVGYRSQAKGDKLGFTLGYSHPIEFDLPTGIAATVDDKQTTITLTGIDKQLLGQVAAKLRELRPPDAYKGKGIRYAGERIKLKAGKTGKK